MTIIETMNVTNLDLGAIENYLFDQGMEYNGLSGRYDTVPKVRFNYEPYFEDYEYLQTLYSGR